MFRNRVFRKLVSAVTLSVFVSVQSLSWPLTAMAAASNAMGQQGSDFARKLGSSGSSNLPSFDGSNMTFTMPDGSTMSIDKGSMAPASGNGINYSTSQEMLDKQMNAYGDDKAFSDAGGEGKDLIFESSQSDTPSIEGMVYSVLRDKAMLPDQDVTGDVFLDKTNQIMDDLSNALKDIANCTSDSVLSSVTETIRVPEEKVCQQVLDRSGDCTIYHRYETSVVTHYSGPYNIKSCGEGCMEVWIGTVGDNYWAGGSCTLYTEEVMLKVINPDAITLAQLDYAAYDDQMQVWIGPQGNETKVYQGPRETFPYEDYSSNRVPGVACELSTHWIWDPNRTGPGCTESSCAYTQRDLPAIDITAPVKSAGENGILRFYLRDAIGGYGEAFARMRIYFDPALALRNDTWSPNDCIQAAVGIEDGFAKGSITCEQGPVSFDSNGCAVFDETGVLVCPDDFKEAPLTSISPFCQQVKVHAEYDFYKGDMGCWQAMRGFDEEGNPIYEEVCPGENAGGNLDTCEQYAEDPDCSFVRSQCTEGMEGKSGTCYVNDVVYNCYTEKTVVKEKEETVTECNGVTCLGEECVDLIKTSSSDFAQVSALMNAMQYMSQDMACEGLDDEGNMTGTENVTCTVFGGQSGWCKTAVGGWVDCCENPSGGVGLSEYIEILISASNLTSTQSSASNTIGPGAAISGSEAAGSFAGQWTEFLGDNKLVNGVKYINNLFSTTLDNLKTKALEIFSPVKELYDTIYNQIDSAITELFNEVAAELGFGGIGTGGAAGGGGEVVAGGTQGSATGALGSVISFVGWVYFAYQVANLIVNLIYACEDIEYETIAKRDQKNCHYLGSWCDQKVLGFCTVKKRGYCCFESPLSRILNEQIRLVNPELIEGGWGSAEHPNCAGITTDMINLVDWDRVDLSEWIDLLHITGNDITPQKTTLENLTGTTSPLNFDKETGRADALERTQDKLTQMDVDTIRKQAARCITLDLGGQTTAGGDCGTGFDPITGEGAECRYNDMLMDCDEVRILNELAAIKGETTSGDSYHNQGYDCYVDGKITDCSSLSGEGVHAEALERYAEELGGTTYQDRYICVDSTGGWRNGVCEAVIRNNTCSNVSGNFTCYDGGKKVECGSLGKTDMDCN